MLRDALVLRRFMLQLFIVWLFHRYRWPENWLFYGFVGIIKQTNNLFFFFRIIMYRYQLHGIFVAFISLYFFFNRLFNFFICFSALCIFFVGHLRLWKHFRLMEKGWFLSDFEYYFFFFIKCLHYHQTKYYKYYMN